MDELLKLTKENNILLKKIYKKLMDMTSQDQILKNAGISLGVGICSTIVGDRILGL